MTGDNGEEPRSLEEADGVRVNEDGNLEMEMEVLQKGGSGGDSDADQKIESEF